MQILQGCRVGEAHQFPSSLYTTSCFWFSFVKALRHTNLWRWGHIDFTSHSQAKRLKLPADFWFCFHFSLYCTVINRAARWSSIDIRYIPERVLGPSSVWLSQTGARHSLSNLAIDIYQDFIVQVEYPSLTCCERSPAGFQISILR